MSNNKKTLAAWPRCFESGYTITEVLIFLAISSALAVTVLISLSGQQRRTEFSQSSREAESKINDIMNDFVTGFSPAIGTNCTAGAAGGPPTFSGGTNEQGTNYGCTYIGKVIQFSPDGNADRMRIFTVVGRQFKPGGILPIENIIQARPKVAVTATEVSAFGYGLAVGNVTAINQAGTPQPIGAVGFFSSFAKIDSIGPANKVASGSQSTTIIPIPTTVLGQDEAQAIAAIENIVSYTYAQLQAGFIGKPVQICLLDNNQRALLDIGDNNQRAATKLTIENASTCP